MSKLCAAAAIHNDDDDNDDDAYQSALCVSMTEHSHVVYCIHSCTHVLSPTLHERVVCVMFDVAVVVAVVAG